jgi:ABC-type spermidine/putrescine transport system permease subunit II
VIYGAARTAPTPAINAVGSLMLATSTLIIVIAFLLYRRSEKKRGTEPAPV